MPADADIRRVHRRLSNADIYFLSNGGNTFARIEARFHVSGKAPDIWRADSGGVTPVSYRTEGAQTVVPLSFDPEDSYFVVFRRSTARPSMQLADVAPTIAATLDSPWSVAFQPGRGAQADSTLTALTPLNDNNDVGIRYLSGVATYTTTFNLPAVAQPGAKLWLDLGSVTKPGDNQLDIRVANLWVNRLIGDAQPGAKKIGVTLVPTYRVDAPLRPADLIGPVRLLTAATHQ